MYGLSNQMLEKMLVDSLKEAMDQEVMPVIQENSYLIPPKHRKLKTLIEEWKPNDSTNPE